jgi:hypothetical protein
VTTVIGKLSAEGDPRGIEIAYGALVTLAVPERDKQLAALRASALALDKKVAAEIGADKTTGRVEPRRVRIAEALAATGWYGPILPGANERFADPVVRDTGGDGVIVLINVADAVERVVGERIARAFGSGEEVAARRAEWGGRALAAFVALRETVGWGTDGTERRPREFLQNRLGDHRAPIAELRADLTALYLAFSEEVRAIGLVPDNQCARAVYDGYLSRTLEQLAFVDEGSPLARPQLQAAQITVQTLIAEHAVTEQREGGRVSLEIADYGKMREVIGELLAEVRAIRHGGQSERAAALIERLGRVPAPGWGRSAAVLWQRAELPGTLGFVYPVPVERTPGGEVDLEASESFVDAQISSITEAFN